MNHKPRLYVGWNPCCLRLNALTRFNSSNRFGTCNQGYRRAWETNGGLDASGSRLPLYVSASHGDNKLKLLSILKARLHTGYGALCTYRFTNSCNRSPWITSGGWLRSALCYNAPVCNFIQVNNQYYMHSCVQYLIISTYSVLLSLTQSMYRRPALPFADDWGFGALNIEATLSKMVLQAMIH